MRVNAGINQKSPNKLLLAKTLMLLIVVLVAVGCSQEKSKPTPPPEQVFQTGTDVEGELETTEPAPEPETPLPTVEEAAPTSAAEAAYTASTPTAIETREEETSGLNNGEAQESLIAFNGVYGDSYFRGAESASVTIVDYSDFL